MLISFVLECLSLVLYTMFGMALIPDIIAKNEEGEREEAAILIAPIVGAAVWQAAGIVLGFTFPYGKLLLVIMLVLAGAFVLYKRKCLYMPRHLAISLFISVTVLASLVVLWWVLPREIDGGIYFALNAFDHQRAACINAIAACGLPPLNPYAAIDGQFMPLLYHYGWHAIIAQYCILLGASGTTAGAAGLAFSCTMVVFAMGYVAYKFVRRDSVLFLLMLFAATGAAIDVMKKLLPQALQDVLYPKYGLGFYSFINACAWAPHALFGVAVTIVILVFYFAYLKCKKKRDILYLTVLLSLMAAGAVESNVYSGGFALLLAVLSMLPIYLFHKDFRQSFNRLFPYQVFCLFLTVLLSTQYFMCLLGGVSGMPLAFGVIPGYEVSGIVDVIRCFFNFYLFTLPIENGLFFTLGIILILFWKPERNKLFASFIKSYTIVTLLAVFFIYSVTLVNDFGGRTLMPLYSFALAYAAAFFGNRFAVLKENGKAVRKYVLLTIFLICPFVFNAEYIANSTVYDAGAEKHRIFAKAKDGWEAIRENTTYEDLVTCNPEGFLDFCIPGASVNYLYSYYADRMNYLADSHYAKNMVLLSNVDITEAELDNRYQRLVNFFSGNPDRTEVDYMADECKVKALLVTPVDGLWDTPGDLTERYSKVIEGDCYKAYIMQ